MKRKVLLVDDSMFMNRILSDFISSSNELEVVGIAKNGKEAVELNSKLEPDVILLDVEMPVMNGLDSLKLIMKERPCAVVMFSSITKQGAEITIKALQEGACDFVSKPKGKAFDLSDDIVDEIIEKLKYAKFDQNFGKYKINKPITTGSIKSESKSFKNIIGIGASTGGPKALQKVLEELEANFPAPIVIVQHMPKLFTKPFAERLNGVCNLRVKEAEHDDELTAGNVYIAHGDSHMRVVKTGNVFKIKTDNGPKVSGHRPSVDVLFESLVELIKDVKITAVQMTGMGRDGAEAMKKLHDRGARCIVQNKETSIVYGMPGSAVELGAYDMIVPLEKISNEILRSLEV